MRWNTYIQLVFVCRGEHIHHGWFGENGDDKVESIPAKEILIDKLMEFGNVLDAVFVYNNVIFNDTPVAWYAYVRGIGVVHHI